MRLGPSSRPEPSFVPPYPPSWFDRLKHWVERRPGPFWLLYLLLWLGLYAAESILHWRAAAYPFGTLNPLHAILTGLVPGALCLMHALDRLAERSFDAFRPVVRTAGGEMTGLRYQLTTMPRRPAAMAVVAFVVFGLAVSSAGSSHHKPVAISPWPGKRGTLRSLNAAIRIPLFV